VRYVSPSGSDTTGDGSANNPFATIFKAGLAIQAASGTSAADNGTVYLMAGDYDWAGSNGPDINTSSGWITIAAVPGVSASQVRITTSGGASVMLHTKLVHLKDITVFAGVLRQSNDITPMVWFDGCILTGTSTTQDNPFAGPTAFTGGVFVTDTSVQNNTDGVTCATLQRNVAVDNIGSDAFQNAQMLVNCVVSNITVPGGQSYHPDVLQLFGMLYSNVIYYGVTATQNINAQGLFLDHGDQNTSLQDAAFVNFNINTAASSQVFQFCAPSQNVLILNGNFTGGTSYWRPDFQFTAIDFVVRNTRFSSSPGAIDGVSYE
jgi:hypothetical protein